MEGCAEGWLRGGAVPQSAECRQLKQFDSLQFLLIDFSVQICCQHGLLVLKETNNQKTGMALVVHSLAAGAISGAMLCEFPG